MDSLKEAQVQLYQALNSFGVPCLLRVCSSSDALWVCDLPRRLENAEGAKQYLTTLSVRCAEEKDGLWRLDWTADKYRQLSQALPTIAPPLPKAAELHEAYALCRLLLAHPTPVEAQPLEPVRQVLKLSHQPPAKRQCIIGSLMDDCAVRLRQHQPLSAIAGGLLANWLQALAEGESK